MIYSLSSKKFFFLSTKGAITIKSLIAKIETKLFHNTRITWIMLPRGGKFQFKVLTIEVWNNFLTK